MGRNSLLAARRMLVASLLAAGAALAFAGSSDAAMILAISVCGAGTTQTPSCYAGTSDTQKVVLGTHPRGKSINKSGLVGVSDEHSSIFAPDSLGSNPDYLFFVASDTRHHPNTGLVVLSGGKGPGAGGQWTLRRTKGYGDYGGKLGQVFMAPAANGACPTVPDRTFDLDYAAPGSIVPDPSIAKGLLMVYEGTNECSGGNAARPSAYCMSSSRHVKSTSPYFTLGVATSNDYGKTWPTYAPTSTFAFVPLPCNSASQGPSTPLGGFGNQVCNGNLLVSNACDYAKPFTDYGRYAVLSPPCTLAELFNAKQAVNEKMGDSEPSAFLDDVHGGTPTLYIVHTYNPGASTIQSGPACQGDSPLTDGRSFDLTIAAASLAPGAGVPGTGPGAGALLFSNWNGTQIAPLSSQSFNGTLNYSPETQLLGDATPVGPGSQSYRSCQDPVNESRSDGSISWYRDTDQYVLLFVCQTSQGDPNPFPGEPGSSGPGAAWFYSTTSQLATGPWATPQEVTGSWNPEATKGFYNGWYPTLMSLGLPPGQLSTQGYAFYLWGCESGTCGGRRYASRAFTIQTSGGPYTVAPNTKVSSAHGYAAPGSAYGSASVHFKADEPGSAFLCSLNGAAPGPCVSPVRVEVKVATRNTFAVHAINPFGIAGPTKTAIVTVTYKPGGHGPRPSCGTHCV
jgi:hypothetical protein